MVRRHISQVALAGVLFLGAAPLASAQVVSLTETPLRPFAGPGEQPSTRGADPTPFTRFFVTAGLTAAGTATDGSGNSVTVGLASAAGYQFPSVRLTISVAPRMMANDPSPHQERLREGELIRMNAHVTVQALDAAGIPLPSTPGTPAVQTLAISPSDPSTTAGQASNSVTETKQAFTLLTSHLGVVGATIAAFEGAFHVHPGPSQVAYQGSANEFGWGWFRGPGAPIEGLHYTAALFQVPKAAAALRLSVELVSDWQRFGPWVKTYDIVMALK